MPTKSIPVLVPLSEKTHFGEIPETVFRIAERIPDRFATRLFLFAIVPQSSSQTVPLEYPRVVERMMLACMDTQVGETIISAMQMIEHRDALRIGVPPGPRVSPILPREKLSFRKIFEWMESASATVITYSIGQDPGQILIGFVRTKETVENFMAEWKLLTKASEASN
jgi:hypothetical protein